MKNVTRIAAVLACMIATSSGAAVAEKVVRIQVKDTATYDTALSCFGYYAIIEEYAAKVKSAKGAPPEAVKEQTVRGQVAAALRASWNKRIVKTRGDKTEVQVNADLSKANKPLIATANAAIGGDKAALAKHNAMQDTCNGYEKVEEVDAPPPAPK